MRRKPPIRLLLASGLMLAAMSTSAQSGAALPYTLAQAVQRYPVTLYTARDCAPCDGARAFLNRRGIPFSEKTIGSDAGLAALKNLAHTSNVPVLAIGTQTLDGFSESDWSQYLDAAGYPKTSQLPKGWQNAAASPLAPAQPVGPRADDGAAAQSAPAASEPQPPVKPEPSANNPAGIRF